MSELRAASRADDDDDDDGRADEPQLWEPSAEDREQARALQDLSIPPSAYSHDRGDDSRDSSARQSLDGSTASSAENSDTSVDEGAATSITYDTSLTAAHSYLGEREDLGGVSELLQHGMEVFLPMYLVHDLVVFPGETMPLRLLGNSELQILRTALNAPPPLKYLIAVVRIRPSQGLQRLCSIGCIAEFRQAQWMGNMSFNCIATCRQRLRIDENLLVDNPLLDKIRVPLTALRELEFPPIPREVGLSMTAWGAWAYSSFDAAKLADRARELLSLTAPQVKTLEGSPLRLSYWLASNMPFDMEWRQRLLEAPDEVDRLQLIIQMAQSSGMTEMVCRSCHTKIGSSRDTFAMTDHGPGGTFVNMHGHIHDMVTLRRVCFDLVYEGEPETEYSWFPGYAWTICSCACRAHLGWRFTSTRPELQPRCFWGLRFSQVTSLAESGVAGGDPTAGVE